MNNENDAFDFFNSLFGHVYQQSETDIIADYVNGKIDKDEFIRRLDNARRNKVR